MSYSVSELAELLGLSCQGDTTRRLIRVSSWDSADAESIVFLDSPAKHMPPDVAGNACLITSAPLAPVGSTAILSDRPKLDFARAAALLVPSFRGRGQCHPTAAVSPGADVDDDVDIGPHVTIGAGARIRGGTILHAGVVIGDGCNVGMNCLLHPRVVLYPGAILRNRVILHAGVVVGGDGFGYVFDGRSHFKFPQSGSVVIEDDVEIGCNTTIDRGSLGATRIGAGTKIDNLVQVAHNVHIGRAVIIAAQTGISGSTTIDDHAVIGGQVGLGDHAHVQKGVVIGSKAGVLPGKIVRSGDVYWGIPVRPLREFKRLNALFGRLPEMKEEIESLRKAVLELVTRLDRRG